jgi:phage terminase large subunit-like protein
MPPEGDWNYWLLMAGRGFGKTRTGAETIRRFAAEGYRRIHLVGATAADVRDVMITGESGLLSCYPPAERPLYEPSKRLITFANGAQAMAFSADEPERLRGPQCLVGSTLVTMGDGALKPLSEVVFGDFVQTRKGARKVLSSRITNSSAQLFQLKLLGGRNIIGTAEHPVFIDRRGYVPLSQIGRGELCVISASSWTGEPTTSEKRATTRPRSACIAKSGVPRTGSSPKDSTFTIRTRTSSTTASRIWNFCRSRITRAITAAKISTPSKKRRESGPLLRDLETWQSGLRRICRASFAAGSITVPLRRLLDTVPLHASSAPGPLHSMARTGSASGAASNIEPHEEFRSIARSDATRWRPQTAPHRELSGKLNAQSAELQSQPTALTLDSAADSVPLLFTGSVVSVERLHILSAVYDLTVEGEHEFFANGILVHNCDAFWADEVAAWRFAQDAWDNLMFGFRLGAKPRGVITTTPKPIKLVKDILTDPATVVTRGSSYENRSNLAPAFFSSIIRKYEGTRIGRQELLAELLEDVPGALWSRRIIDANRVTLGDVRWEQFRRIVVAIDPAVSANEDSDLTGIIVAGLTPTGHVLVLDDDSCKESPLGWARIAIARYKSRRADRIVGEVNNGGDLVEANIRAVDPNAAFRAVRASRGKAIRAEPVAALYEQGRIHHVGSFPELEDEMCGWSPQTGEKSPDRMDALVWAVTDLLIDQEQIEMRHSMGDGVQISPI